MSSNALKIESGCMIIRLWLKSAARRCMYSCAMGDSPFCGLLTGSLKCQFPCVAEFGQRLIRYVHFLFVLVGIPLFLAVGAIHVCVGERPLLISLSSRRFTKELHGVAASATHVRSSRRHPTFSLGFALYLGMESLQPLPSLPAFPGELAALGVY